MSLIHPILFVDLLKQSSYKNTILLSLIHKQLTYFSKKYSKSNRITLSKLLPIKKRKDNVKSLKYALKIPKYVSYYNCTLECKYNVINGKFDFCCYKILATRSAANGNTKSVRLLINKDDTFNKYDVLISAVWYGHFKVIKLLFEKHANIHENHDNALRLSAKCGNTKIVEYLLKKGANVHARNDHALIDCVFSEDIDTLKILLKYGANVHAIENMTLQRLLEKCSINMANMLLDAGINICGIDVDKLPQDMKVFVDEKLKLI